MKFQRTTLENGLEIIAETNEDARSTSLGFFVKTGARDETDEIAGVSHFLEHMVFKGTERRNAVDVNRELDELGGVSNAFTTEEITAFYAKVLPELQERAVDLLGDILRPSLRKFDFDAEKQVILEEIKMYEDQPPFGVDEKWRAFFWKGHPLARSVLGTLDSVGNLSVESMREYFERRYGANNVVFVACGQVDFDKLTSWVDRACGAWKPQETGRESWRPQGVRETRVVGREETSQEYVFQLVDAPTGAESDRFAASILTTILGDDVGSRLFWELVDSGRAETAALYLSSFSDAGAFLTSLVCNPNDVDDNLATIRDVLLEAQQGGITEEELIRAKNKILTGVALSGERPQSRLFAIGEEWTTRGQYRSVVDDLQTLREITLDEVDGVMKKYPFDNPFTIAVGSVDSLRDF